MSASFIRADGSTVTLLVTDVGSNPLRLSTFFGDNVYSANVDTDGDGSDDAIAVDFTGPSSGLPLGYSISAGDGRAPPPIAVVEDYSTVRHGVDYSSRGYTLPNAFLGSHRGDTVSGDDLTMIAGNDGNDVIMGGRMGQIVFGGNGNDTIDGFQGDDILDGGAGRDRLTGGSGSDVFVFSPGFGSNRDTVVDFSQEESDRVDLSGLPAGLHLVESFSGTGPEARFRSFGDHTALIFDLNGDGVSDARVTFLGDVHFSETDFIFPG